MEKKFTNKEVANLLRNVSSVYQIKGKNKFQIRAYDLAADSIEISIREVKDLFEAGNLNQIPRVGTNIAKYLDEYFTTGKVTHFDDLFNGVPDSMFDLLKVPGIGPKTALRLAETGVVSIQDLENRIKSGWLIKKGYSEKILDNIMRGVEEFKRKSDRILLSAARELADQVLEYLKKHKEVLQADTLGSIRRKVETVGDVDIAVATNSPKVVIEHFTKFPGTQEVIEAGDKKATISIVNGTHVDLMVQSPERYGSLQHHFTGSKNHNIHIRSIAKGKGYSISEYGVKELKSGKNLKFKTEKDIYSLLGMQMPTPEIREDNGEIEAAQKNKLPSLIELEDIRGDMQTHSTWSDGQNSLEEVGKSAASIGREYVALTDHSYPSLDFDRRLRQIEQYNYSQNRIRVLSGLEVNINADSTLQVPNDILRKHDVVLVSIHTSFRQSELEMTNRIIKALENPYVHIFAHPTGRLLLEREGVDADWEKIFKVAANTGKFMEINAFPNRLDLPDNLIRLAKQLNVKFSIGTDSHQVSQLTLMENGVANAKRGWVETKDVINTLPYSKLKDILKI